MSGELITDEFLTELLTEAVRPGRARTVERFSFFSARLQTIITVPAGFEFDWDSVPRIPGVHALLKGRAERAACVHDWMYYAQCVPRPRADPKPISRRQADQVFLDAMVAEGVSWRHRWAIYLGVRAGGCLGWRRHRRRDDPQGLIYKRGDRG